MNLVRKIALRCLIVSAALVVLESAAAETLPTWTYYETNSVLNTAHPGMGYITDGTWELCARHYDAVSLTILDAGIGRNAIFNETIPSDTLDMRGTITDADSGASLTISHLVGKPLGADSTRTPSTPKKLILPTTLSCGLWGYLQGATVDTNGDEISECVADYTNIVLHVTGWFETITAKQRPTTSGKLYWDLELPQLRHISGYALMQTASGVTCNSTTAGRLNENSLLSLQELANHTFANCDFSGILNLPNATYAESWGGNCAAYGLSDILIGTNGNKCTSLDTGCFGWNYAMTNAVLGLAANNKIGDQIFSGCRVLSRVKFTGYPPNFTASAGAFVTTSAKYTTFVIPATPAWRTFLAKGEAAGTFTRWSDAEVLAYANAHPDKPAIIGVAQPKLFRTTNAQYVALDRTVALSSILDYDTAFGDTVTCDAEPDGEGRYPQGIALTFTAHPNTEKGGVFAGWYGDVPGGKCMSETVTVDSWSKAGDLLPHVYARFTHPWKLVEQNGKNAIISNGVYRINVTVSGTNISLSQGARALFAADNTVDGGVVDFGGPITDAAGTSYRITVVYETTESLSLPKNSTYGARVFVSPGTCMEWVPYGSQVFHASNGRWTYETIIIDEPTATGYVLGDWMYSDQRYLKYLILRGTNLTTKASQNGALYACLTKYSDFAWWDLPNCSFGNGQFALNASQYISGSLSLANGRSIGASAFSANTCLSELRMGFGAKKSCVTSLGASAFSGCTGLTNIVLNASPDLTVGTDAFASVSKITTVTMHGKAPSAAAFAGLLQGVVAKATKPAIVYVSSRFPSWSTASFIEKPTEEELASAPEGETVLGVYRGGAEAPAGKAWICDRISPFDPVGNLLLLR